MAFLTIISLLSVAAYLLYKWATRDFDIFAQRGIPYAKPYPLVGNSVAVLGGRSSFHKEIMQICKKFKDQKVFGYFNMQQPAFVVTDPEYIKKICIKDFDYFPNHRPFVRAENEKMVTSMLSIMQDQRWKDMRTTLTPVFTASKMRTMFSLMNECFDESLKYLAKQQTPDKDGGFDLELKQCCTRLSNDIIASTAFGLKINSYEQQDNEFYSIGQGITNFRGKQMLKFFLAASFPKLMDRLGVRIFDSKKCNYFMRLVVDAMKYRKEHNVHRADMIQLLIEAKDESEHNWSDEELVAQCFVFFFAAFENNANLICTTCHELMLNPEVQERLYEEACDIRNELNGSALNYDMVNKMKYMDMVVSESLRKWSLAAMTDRVCSKDYKLYDDDGNFVVEFKKGDNIWIPIAGIHMNEDNYESPEVFDPERFSEENKKNINPFKYLPFGVGPRNCIGNRYALMQAKAMLYYLVLNYKFQRSAKTVPNLLDAMRGFQVNPANGFWLRFVPRK